MLPVGASDKFNPDQSTEVGRPFSGMVHICKIFADKVCCGICNTAGPDDARPDCS